VLTKMPALSEVASLIVTRKVAIVSALELPFETDPFGREDPRSTPEKRPMPDVPKAANGEVSR